MPEVAGDGDDRDAGGDEHRCTGVPKVVQADLFDAAFDAPFGKPAVGRTVGEWVIAAEDELLPSCSSSPARHALRSSARVLGIATSRTLAVFFGVVMA